MLSDYSRSGEKVLMLPSERNFPSPRHETIRIIALDLEQPQRGAVCREAPAPIRYTKVVLARRDTLRLRYDSIMQRKDLHKRLICPVLVVDCDGQPNELRLDRIGEYCCAGDQKSAGTNDGLHPPVHPKVKG